MESVSGVEVEVLQSGSVQQLPQRRGRGRPRKLAGGRSQARRKGGGRTREEQDLEKVVSDGQFDMPISTTEVLGRESAVEGDVPVVFTASPAVPRPESSSVTDQVITQPGVQVSTRTPSASQSLTSHQASSSPSINTSASVTTVLPVSVAESAAQVQAVDLRKASPHQQHDEQTSRDSETPLEVTASVYRPEGSRDTQSSGGTASQQKGRGRQRKRTLPAKRAIATQSSSDASQSETVTSPAVQRPGVDALVRRSNRKRSGNSGSEASPLSSLPAKRTRQTNVGGEGVDGGRKDPASWGVEEVAEFIGTIPHCTYYTQQVFKEHVSNLHARVYTHTCTHTYMHTHTHTRGEHLLGPRGLGLWVVGLETTLVPNVVLPH